MSDTAKTSKRRLSIIVSGLSLGIALILIVVFFVVPYFAAPRIRITGFSVQKIAKSGYYYSIDNFSSVYELYYNFTKEDSRTVNDVKIVAGCYTSNGTQIISTNSDYGTLQNSTERSGSVVLIIDNYNTRNGLVSPAIFRIDLYADDTIVSQSTLPV